MSDVLKCFFEQVFARVAGDAAQRRIDDLKTPVEGDERDAGRGVFKRAVKPLLAFAQCFLRPFLLGDVAVDFENERRFARFVAQQNL